MTNLAPSRAMGAIETYEADNAHRYSGESEAVKLADLIADVLLFAKAEGLDYEFILDYARIAFEEEEDEV
ncbi:hypothetical protein E1264_03425 [Actinomadura sp. KC216]|uniref:hypothetical protein n=1 Tax=Actinomadura sp. KC216 TaxID=2530370 RepID=UPI001049EA30|nr:hypothetical protein [Actinomadura sp. KC216]TDB90890.1 hypothetical protein E1264_03425 [Actinomadura sp. KC216]